MNYKPKHAGFSLTEVLMAVGILAVGLIFIAGTFPVGIYLTTVATEQTIAAIVADEAFAKIKLYDVNTASLPPVGFGCVNFNGVVSGGLIDPNEFAYPSINTNPNPAEKKYYWSALCRYIEGRNVQVTVFVSRRISAGGKYPDRNPFSDPLNPTAITISPYPIPVPVAVSQIAPDKLSIIDNLNDPFDEKSFINNGYTIVDNTTGLGRV